jgi:hypothetical protein
MTDGSRPEIGTHVASLNLFVENDGTLFVTVAGANCPLATQLAREAGWAGGVPNDAVLHLVGKAENIK